jgi:hypothetical protein
MASAQTTAQREPILIITFVWYTGRPAASHASNSSSEYLQNFNYNSQTSSANHAKAPMKHGPRLCCRSFASLAASDKRAPTDSIEYKRTSSF